MVEVVEEQHKWEWEIKKQDNWKKIKIKEEVKEIRKGRK